MRFITHRLLKIFVKDYENFQNPEVRARYGYLEAGVSIFINLILSILKFFLGIVSNSIALLADAFHTFSDLITSTIVWIGFKASRRPADKKHPFGHGRIEFISTLIMGVLLVIAGINFLKESFLRIIKPQKVEGGIGIIIFLIFSSYIKEELAIFAEDLGKRIKGDSLLADAWHHRTDAIASLLIIISIIASRFGYFIVDALLGLIISIFIVYMGGKFVYDSSSRLIGHAPSKEIINKIQREAYRIKGVRNVHDIEIHEYGEELRVSLHIGVKAKMNVDSAHQIADAVEKRLKESLGISAVVHVDPL